MVIRRVWPILVTANLTQPEGLHDVVGERLPPTMNDARIQTLVLMDPGDLEVLIALVEEGRSMVDVLRRRQESPYARLEFFRWVNEGPSMGVPGRARFAQERWNRVAARIHDLLGIPRLAETESTGA
jgi:hypothetical protein